MSYLNSQPRTPKICPVCGEEVPPRALACPECGADHKSGWKKNACNEDGLNLPDDEFTYEEFIKREFGGGGKSKRVKLIWWLTALVILAILLWLEFEGK